MPERHVNRSARRGLGGVAPFGRLGRWLGFRWAFPIGTMAVPFHPLLARVLPWLPVAVVAYVGALTLAGRDGAVSPGWLLSAAALLGLLLSVPVLQYAFLAFRLALLQGALVSGAMALIAVDVAAGRSAWGWGVLPAAYAASYLVQRLGGPLALRRVERRNAELAPWDPGHRGVEVTGWRADETAQWLVEHCDLPRVSASGGLSRLRVDAATYARVGEVAVQMDTGTPARPATSSLCATSSRRRCTCTRTGDGGGGGCWATTRRSGTSLTATGASGWSRVGRTS